MKLCSSDNYCTVTFTTLKPPHFYFCNLRFYKDLQVVKIAKKSLYPQIEQFWFQIFASTFIPEVVDRRGFVEKVCPAALLKGDPGAGVFLEILRNF